jgi:hypothetical protein
MMQLRKLRVLTRQFELWRLPRPILGVQAQVNSIERQLRETKTEIRLGPLEEKVFGAARR